MAAGDNRGPELQAICATFIAMAFIALSLRVYVRSCMVKAFGSDDALMVVAFFFYIWYTTSSMSGAAYGTGRHMGELSDDEILKAMRFWWNCYLSFFLTMICAKLSIGLFLLRVTVSNVHRWSIYIAMGLSVVSGLAFFFVTLVQCTPVDYFWNKHQPGKCLNMDVIVALTYFYSIMNALCDFTFGLLPVFLVWQLNMSKRSKLMLIPILSMGCVASTAVIVRMPYVSKFKSNDFLYDTVDIAIWSTIEQGLAVTAGSLATLRPLYRAASERLGWSRSASNAIRPSGDVTGTPFGDRSGFTRRSGPYSLGTFNTRHEGLNDEEFRLHNVKPMRLSDDPEGGDAKTKNEQGFSSWRIQCGKKEGSRSKSGSEEELNGKFAAGGITVTRQTDVF
ncbi:hypothetical protein P154DRAFT_540728 [Amniculicola lignicola CBS 123094]|uniref:Rhodopsin domain-containing protein n=1 Tax=Amniculicola lignicola CBS 123094 TaxID=1392246 RepID=A0A6A5VYW6_9PLEO|nr:hypothetical protein P154DRAFT_540728 [Amniculicola lignicola CBS 123094]